MNWQEWIPKIQEVAIQYGTLALQALVIFIIGRWIAKALTSLSRTLMKRSGMDDMLRKFVGNIVYALLMTFVIIATIGKLGIQTASLVAVIGAAGLAVGLALQGSLANFAAGVLMIIFRPYKITDLVEVGGDGTEGFVEEVDIFTTVLRLPDQTKIIVPNGQVMSNKITNYTDAKVRRMELSVGIAYNEDIDQARDAIMKTIVQSEYVVADPAPQVTVAELADSSVNLAVRPWVHSDKYAPASHELNERVKKALDAAGISIPFPQRDLHIIDHTKND